MLPDAFSNSWRGQEFEECFAAFRLLGFPVNRAGKYRNVLQLGRKRADNLDTLYGNKLTKLMEAEVCITAHELVTNRFIRLRDGSLRLDLIVDAQSLEH